MIDIENIVNCFIYFCTHLNWKSWNYNYFYGDGYVDVEKKLPYKTKILLIGGDLEAGILSQPTGNFLRVHVNRGLLC
jgi:hypothetical protein